MKLPLHALTTLVCFVIAACDVRAQEKGRLTDSTERPSTTFEIANVITGASRSGFNALASDNNNIAATPPLRKLALVVGNGAYQFVIPTLSNPTNDATLIANNLQQVGFTLIGGGVQSNLTIAQFQNAVQQFSTQAANADVVVFYYAGHGVQQNGVNYLVPVDSNPVNGTADFPNQMIDASTVLDGMDKANIRLKILILDACRDNPFRSLGLAPTTGLADMS